MIKLYYPKSFFDDTYRWHIFPLLKQLMSKDLNSEDFQFVTDEKESDVMLLPMSWNYYYDKKRVDEVMSYVNKIGHQKPVFSFVFGDVGNKVPSQFNGIVLRTSGDKSKLPLNHKGIPVFLEDPMRIHYKTDAVFTKSFSSIPIVGFCGLATPFTFDSVVDVVRVGVKNILSQCGLSYKNPQKLMSTTYFRYKILKRLENSDSINANFIIRNQYRAGVKTNKETHSSTSEFYDNIRNSDYIVCIRGAGNFSTRFYETLAMGRIPVFVNTDCLLPLEDAINWKEHVVWVEYKDRHKIVEKILEFHVKLDQEKLNALFERNRKLWETHLTLLPYFKTLFNEST